MQSFGMINFNLPNVQLVYVATVANISKNLNDYQSFMEADVKQAYCTVCFLDSWPQTKCRVTFDTGF